MKSTVYVLPDSQGRILRIEGQYSLPEDLTGWVLIEEGESCDRLNLAQSHYFPGSLCTEDGIPKYKLVEGQPQERTAEAIEADRAALPQPEPSGADAVTWDELAAAIQEGVNSV